jgi:antitoxin PrlF
MTFGGVFMPTTTVTSKGQITIPVEVRKALNIKPGTKIVFYETSPGHFAFIAKTRSIQELKGILPKLGYVPTIEEMNEAVLDAVSENYLAGLPKPPRVKGDEAA